MDNLKEQISELTDAVVAQLEQKYDDLEAKQIAVVEQKNKLDKAKKEFEAKVAEAKEIIKSAEKLGSIEEQNNALAIEKKEVGAIRIENSKKTVELVEKNNRLVSVQNALNLKEKAIIDREKAVSQREIEYKDKLKKEFLEQLSKATK